MQTTRLFRQGLAAFVPPLPSLVALSDSLKSNANIVEASIDSIAYMTAFQRFSEACRQWRKLVLEYMNLNSDVWNERRVTARHQRAIWWFAVATSGVNLLFWWRLGLMWVLIEALLCMIATFAPVIVLLVILRAMRRNGRNLDGSPKLPGPSSLIDEDFWSLWAALSPAERAGAGLLMATGVLVSLAAGHMSLWGWRSYVLPLLGRREFIISGWANQYISFIPEFFWASIVAMGLLRFLYGHRWQRRLDEEKLKREAAEQGQALAQAQLKLLQAQIEPHFLFNTLASVQHLVRKDPPRADFLLSQLIRYLREAMPDIRGMGSTLGREFGLAEAYLNIVKIRLDGRLEIKVNIAQELADVSFPVLIVQTLVENAIKHGIEPKPGPVHIDVTATETMVEGKQFIDVCVSDDGVGFGVAETMGSGIGLRNIRERLAGLYGPNARLDITNVMPSGVCATVRIPGRN